MSCDKLTNPLYKQTLFVSYNELRDMIKDLQSTQETSATKSEARDKMKGAFLSLLSTRIGSKEAKNRTEAERAGSDGRTLARNVFVWSSMSACPEGALTPPAGQARKP